jgi:adenylate kinase
LKLRVIRFSLSDDSVISRLSNRYVCQNKECQAVYSLKAGSALAPKQELLCDACSGKIGRRKDDNETAVQERLKIYHRHEQELLNFYEKIGQQVNEINVEKTLNQVFDEFKRVVGLGKYDCN